MEAAAEQTYDQLVDSYAARIVCEVAAQEATELDEADDWRFKALAAHDRYREKLEVFMAQLNADAVARLGEFNKGAGHADAG